MGMPQLTQVIVDGVDVTSYLIIKPYGWLITEEINETLQTATLNLVKAVGGVLDSSTDYLIGKTVIIKRGELSATEDFVFEGEVVKIQPNKSTLSLSAKSKLYQGVRYEVTESFDIAIDPEAGVGSEIFKTLWNDYTDIVADNTSVVSTGSINTITKFICNHASVYERALSLCNIYDYQMYWNASTQKVAFEPKGYTNNSTILRVGVNIVAVPKWTYDEQRITNKLTVIGTRTNVETTEYFNGNGSTAVFNLQRTPVSMKVYYGQGTFDPTSNNSPHNDSSNLKVGGKVNSTAGTFDYTYDPENKQIIFQDSSIPPIGTKNIEVNYTTTVPLPVVSYSYDSINKYGERAKTIFMPDLQSISDLQNYANTYLTKYKDAFINSTILVTNTTGLQMGQTIRVIDPINNIDKYLLITSIKKQYPYKYDELIIGDLAWKTAEWGNNINKRIRRLEEDLSKNQEVLVSIFPFANNILYKRRYMKILQNGSTPLTITQGNNEYREFLYDNDFIDTTASTAVVSDMEVLF